MNSSRRFNDRLQLKEESLLMINKYHDLSWIIQSQQAEIAG